MSGSTSSAGTSKIELDSKLLNSLLSIFVNKPGGLQVHLSEQGNLQVQQGDLQVGVDPFLISQALKVHLRNGSLGPFTVQLNQLQMGSQGLTLSLQLLT
ncbi:MAG: hypothetical protein KF760_05565 [Candidatus Eremiobacteraeota bacterium]|nr:hypothetical protein [Candidatus Eremiobacteraeota bacterium]MCW5870049.1 hypothetical protein [Candidatus Eremiobacteraeota bacterium]